MGALLHPSGPPHGLEILAPAGNAEMLSAAVYSGADAVYLGFAGFNARRTAGNFDTDTLAGAVAFCHARGVRVHAALNILVYDNELDNLARAIRCAAEAGVDALIVDDLATAALARQIAPGLALHGSTQMSIHTPEGACQLAEMGFSRVILARELSLKEIRAITAKSPIEVEIFVHGALCMAMSGQCMMSAFLGGRSGNRGACAGPCRLPFDASDLRPGKPGQACHLSLKDMDLIPHMADIMAAGVASVKIEGRLRTPEYTAASVVACRCAREGQPYDEALVRDIFSRSGFTDGYFTGKNDGAMFGVRTEADAERSRLAAPKARELFRREYSRVPVDFTLTVTEDGARLTAADREGSRVSAYTDPDTALSPAKNDPAPALEKSLQKTGGTPFVAASCAIEQEGGPWFLPGSVANDLRRRCLDALLEKRSQPHPLPVQACSLPAFTARTRGSQPKLAARFARVDQMPRQAADLPLLIFPLWEAENVPAGLRGKTLIELPRAMYGIEEKVLRRVEKLRAEGGFKGFVINNLAQFRLTGDSPVYGGLGLNVTNPLSALRCGELGAKGLLIHPETPVSLMGTVGSLPEGKALPTAVLCYGHIPLMLTRACPLKNRPDHASCAGCSHQGRLRDRKGRDFLVQCGLPDNGIRTVYNPVPLYMGDRLSELPADWAVAAFTTETPQRAAQILALLQTGKPFDAEFTRGLYYNDPTKAQ